MTLRHQTWNESPYDDDYRDFDSLSLNVEPSERAGAPLPNRRKARLRRMLAGIVLVAGTWVAVANLGVEGVIETGKSFYEIAVSNAQDMIARVKPEGLPTTDSTPNNLAGASAPALPNGQPAEAALPELTITQNPATGPAAEEAPSTEAMGTAYAEKAEPAEEIKDQSPKRKRAIAAGLGPDLPNVLLTRLSQGDLKNAGYAIKTALAKTADDASFSWPPKPSREQALFEIRFVQGAPSGCRRYIVTVTKDRWSSTSAALEKCGDVRAGNGDVPGDKAQRTPSQSPG
ncbi:hypothetical protein [Hyphomicrobium sp. LHD-15]|uniref:hypothetical protein n=1 Tax=Hyphomicrobium sp. LHD-15 TaxID=3072142 RepID=UPI00280D7B00|nr:hypothetical protein [Hyphomicrobium sp. LHD-15]MDQ8697353.1 hypothetical protein [Hyphomicrobium sp. LHD-15]